MEPKYRGLAAIEEIDDSFRLTDKEVADDLFKVHNHTCWLNPTGTFLTRRTKRLCKRFCKKNGIPKDLFGDYDCDYCPNLITYYRDGNNFLYAIGNTFLYEDQGKMYK